MHVQSQRLPKSPPMFVWERFLKNCFACFSKFCFEYFVCTEDRVNERWKSSMMWGGAVGSYVLEAFKTQISLDGYGSIPINTIFSGMNIHLPAILMFTRGTRFWHTARFQSSCSDVAVLNCLDFQRSSIYRLHCTILHCTDGLYNLKTTKAEEFVVEIQLCGIEVSGQRKILQESPMHQAREKQKAGLLCRYLYIAAMLEPICWTSLKIRCRCCNWPWKASCSLSTLFSLFRVVCFSKWRQESREQPSA